MILSGGNSITSDIATVGITGNLVTCVFKAHNQTFRDAIKGLGYRWSETWFCWSRTLDPELNGIPEHRAAELASKLVSTGITCNVPDQVAEMVKTASWAKEQTCWVMAIGGKFHLRWRSVDENLYARAKQLPEAAYDHDTKSVTVPPLYYAEVEGFAETHGFAFTKQATSLLGQARRNFSRVILPDIPTPVKSITTKHAVHVCDPDRFMDIPNRNLSTTTPLYPYQNTAVDKLLPLKLGAFFMDMGTGKTRCAIELAVRRQQRISRVVWFTPVSLKLTVSEEIAKHTTGETVYVFDEDTKSGSIHPAFWYVVGIESISSSDRVVLAVRDLIDNDTMVIVDESSYIKGHSSIRSMRITELSRSCRYRLLLSGTPVSQGIEDLFSQMRFLSYDILGYTSFYSFAHKHLEYSDKYPGLVVRSTGLSTLADKISPFTVQITKEECLSELPDKIYDSVHFSLTEEQSSAYEITKHGILSGIKTETIPDWAIFKLFTALQQIVSGFWMRGDELVHLPHKRLDTLDMVLAAIPDNEKVIIWCKFVESLRQISDAYPGSALYYGELNEKKRASEIAKFRGSGCRIMIATQATGGHGLTINEAHYHVFYENEFKYAHRIQAEDRSHRIGQTSPVTYVDIYSNSGIDRRIHAALDKKEDAVKSFRREVNKRKTEEL